MPKQELLQRQMKYIIKNINKQVVDYYVNVQRRIDQRYDQFTQQMDQENNYVYYWNYDRDNDNKVDLLGNRRGGQIVQGVPDVPYCGVLNAKLNKLARSKYISTQQQTNKIKLFQRLKTFKSQYHKQFLQKLQKNVICLQLPLSQPQEKSHTIFLLYKNYKINLDITFKYLNSIKIGNLHCQVVRNYMLILQMVRILKNVLVCQFQFIQILMGKYFQQVYINKNIKKKKQGQIHANGDIDKQKQKDKQEYELPLQQQLKSEVKNNYEKLKKLIKGINIFQYQYVIIPICYDGYYSFILVKSLNSLVTDHQQQQFKQKKNQKGKDKDEDNNNKDVPENKRLYQEGDMSNSNKGVIDFSKLNILICNNFMKMNTLSVQMLKLFIKKAYHQNYNKFIYTKNPIPHTQLMLPKQFAKQDSGLYFLSNLQILFSRRQFQLVDKMSETYHFKKLHLYPHPLPLLLRERLWNLFVKLLEVNDSEERGLICKGFASETMRIRDRFDNLDHTDVIEGRQVMKYYQFSRRECHVDKMQEKEKYELELSYYLDESLNDLKQSVNQSMNQ